MNKLTCPVCGQRCVQLIVKLTVLVDQDKDGFFIDTEGTNDLFRDNYFKLDEVENEELRVSAKDESIEKNIKDFTPVAICYSDECGGIEYKYSEVMKGEEIRVSNKGW